MSENKIKISKKSYGSYNVISIRIKESTLRRIEELAAKTNRSRNEIINILLEDTATNAEIEE